MTEFEATKAEHERRELEHEGNVEGFCTPEMESERATVPGLKTDEISEVMTDGVFGVQEGSFIDPCHDQTTALDQ